MELESDTLAFLALKFPHIPIPEVVYTWLDTELERTFRLLKRIEGQTLQSAWLSLSSGQRDQVATTVAQYCRDISTLRSPLFQSATGRGVYDLFLNVKAESSHPSCRPRLLGPFQRHTFEKYLQKMSKQPTPALGDSFCFYHADLGPTNILVSNDGEVKGILDWESAAFYPRFWVSLKPYLSAGFNLDTPESRREWADLLIVKLSEAGFEFNMKHVEWFRQLDMTSFDINDTPFLRNITYPCITIEYIGSKKCLKPSSITLRFTSNHFQCHCYAVQWPALQPSHK
jgi:Phosphotransferase enzyme family